MFLQLANNIPNHALIFYMKKVYKMLDEDKGVGHFITKLAISTTFNFHQKMLLNKILYII